MTGFFTLVLFAGLFAAWPDRVQGSNDQPSLTIDVHAERGSTVELPCALKLPECGGLHSIKWYWGATRIFIFSEGVGLTASDDEISHRSNMTYEANATKTFLKIPDLKLDDEGLYKCEATYMAVNNRECNNVQHIILTVTVKPEKLIVTNEDTSEPIVHESTLSPVNEGTKLVLNCESGPGKPVPMVTWFNGTQRLEATNSTEVEENGIGTASSRLEVAVTRGDLGASFICRASSPALKEPLEVKTAVVVNVRPLGMDLSGVVNHVVQGSKVILQCQVQGARPAANITWFNGTEPISIGNEVNVLNRELAESPQPYELKTSIIQLIDGTYRTESSLIFEATHYQNGKKFSCHAENIVTLQKSIRPMKKSIILDVYYPPIVSYPVGNITVNETLDIHLICEYIANPAQLETVKWLQDGEEIKLTDDRFDGGTVEQPILIIKNTSSSDMGNYSCVLGNSVGESVSQDYIEVSVLYKPVVEVSTDPPDAVNEADRLNVSLKCEVRDGNPTILTAVQWFLDGDLLKELPECVSNSTPSTMDVSSTFCDIDPSKLLLEVVGRSFHGNYSCKGRNDAGWGPTSESKAVVVYYKPGPASISYEPKEVVKRDRLKLTCSVVDTGRPEVTGYKWMRGQHRLSDENKSVLDIKSADLETQANFTCWAYNEAGDGDPATVFVQVFAPPAFVRKLPPYTGVVYDTQKASIYCSVECVPLCNISWSKDDVPMNFTDNKQYFVKNTYHDPDPKTNDFQSIQSELIWNLSWWPSGKLDRFDDNGKFTCESTPNTIGPGVKSTTHFHVEFPPENINVSQKAVNVSFNQTPEAVTCFAIAHPEPSFRWYREGSNDTISENNVLSFSHGLSERNTGNYICEASNRHGLQKIVTHINVQTRNGSQTARNGSHTARDGSHTARDGGHSETVQVPWWNKFDLLLIIIIVAVVIILAIIIIWIVIYLICRRKRNQAKHNNRVVEMEERDRPDRGAPSQAAATASHPTPAPRWPLKPGVLVHINRSHSLRSGLSTRLDLQSRVAGSRPVSSCLESDSEGRSVLHEAVHTVARTPVRAYRRSKDTRRALSMSNVHEDGMLARANRIRAMFGAQFKDSDTFPGISRDKTAVTYKRIVPPRQRVSCEVAVTSLSGTTCPNYEASVSRKRKKPGADPTQAANNNHVGSVSEGLPDPEMKTFYENLPFHGIQTPPNKLISPKFARSSPLHGTLHSTTSSPASSRPASRPPSRSASICGGSSGYGSTRSHLGPHYSPHNMPRSNSPEPKYNSLKPRRRKHKHAQFYSLRLCRRHQNTHHNYQLYAVPIRKNCLHKSGSVEEITDAHITGFATVSNEDSKTVAPPVPAPRTRRVTDPSQHTYQNVPPPVFPQNSATKNVKTANLYNYQEHYQQHEQELQQYGYPVASSSSNQLTLPLTRSLHHSSVVSPSPMQTTTTTNSVHLNHRHSFPRALIHGDMEMDLVHDHQPRQGGRRHERRKYRKHGNDRKQKQQQQQQQQQRRQDPRRTESPYTFSRETGFNQISQEPRSGSGSREGTYKISYPHYYEDSITECPLDYPSYEGVPREHREREVVDRYSNSNSSLRYADHHHPNPSARGRSKNNKANGKPAKTKRHSTASREPQTRSPSAPPATQYPELQFRDVGQEIDV
ncbi:uncharacterized protein LOC124308652 isoform X7 [Neodiprion virginianus]|uniref:uncharacterized protein LOC124308652 isoform X7 n=1 Tax=Neodiprion virginianus TaxID=2961670 RepID=UPI001EE6D253|nr:uncharacterized protein LOC124308652 isoform X7 [Neodiprion virginianus]XP_046627502.1 uncharacterized protein LOC124308652 isoform X7 [Neodiprion virginianus]